MASQLMARYKGGAPLPSVCKFTLNMSRNKSIKTFPGVVRLTWGIFDIAYVPKLRLSVVPQLSIGTISDTLTLTWYMFKLILEVYHSSRLNTVLFILCQVWLCASPAMSLYCAFRTLRIVSPISSLAQAHADEIIYSSMV